MAAALTAAALSSCTGAPGRDGRDGIATMIPVTLNVPVNMWEYSYDIDNNYYYVTFNMPEIHSGVLKDGAVNVYYIEKNGAQAAMPSVRHREDIDPVTGEKYLYTVTLDYEYDLGTLTIFYTASDFVYEQAPEFGPDRDMAFRCVVMY